VLRPVIEGAFLEGRFVHGLKLETVRPEDAVASSTTPILLIHGAADTHLRLRQSQILHRVNPKTELWIVPGVEHTQVFSSYPREFADRVLMFFAAHSAEGARAA
jgi:pimeloyl-ACP methyl ester carboxylesterase